MLSFPSNSPPPLLWWLLGLALPILDLSFLWNAISVGLRIIFSKAIALSGSMSTWSYFLNKVISSSWAGSCSKSLGTLTALPPGKITGVFWNLIFIPLPTAGTWLCSSMSPNELGYRLFSVPDLSCFSCSWNRNVLLIIQGWTPVSHGHFRGCPRQS